MSHGPDNDSDQFWESRKKSYEKYSADVAWNLDYELKFIDGLGQWSDKKNSLGSLLRGYLKALEARRGFNEEQKEMLRARVAIRMREA